MILNQFQTVCPKLEAKCLGKLGNSKLFSAQSWVISQKKKKRSSPKFRVRNPKFKGFFCPKLGDLQKKKKQNKKKRSSPKFRLLFRPISQIQTFEGGLFSNGGGLFSIFHIKSASKAQKACDFAHFTSQWGARAPPPPPPPPPLATLLVISKFLAIRIDVTGYVKARSQTLIFKSKILKNIKSVEAGDELYFFPFQKKQIFPNEIE